MSDKHGICGRDLNDAMTGCCLISICFFFFFVVLLGVWVAFDRIYHGAVICLDAFALMLQNVGSPG